MYEYASTTTSANYRHCTRTIPDHPRSWAEKDLLRLFLQTALYTGVKSGRLSEERGCGLGFEFMD